MLNLEKGEIDRGMQNKFVDNSTLLLCVRDWGVCGVLLARNCDEANVELSSLPLPLPASTSARGVVCTRTRRHCSYFFVPGNWDLVTEEQSGRVCETASWEKKRVGGRSAPEWAHQAMHPRTCSCSVRTGAGRNAVRSWHPVDAHHGGDACGSFRRGTVNGLPRLRSGPSTHVGLRVNGDFRIVPHPVTRKVLSRTSSARLDAGRVAVWGWGGGPDARGLNRSPGFIVDSRRVFVGVAI